MSQFWTSLLYFVGGGAIGAAVSFFLTKKSFEKQLKENPPINEKMIRAMFRSMGRSPSEKQVREIMRNVNSQR